MGKKILIVDDEKDIRDSIRMVLESNGYVIGEAVDGKNAIGEYISQLSQSPYDLILLDVLMPEIDGLGVLKVLRHEEELRGLLLGKGVPIIMLTALKKPFMEAFDGGCDDYIVKPFENKDLLKKISEKLSSKR